MENRDEPDGGGASLDALRGRLDTLDGQLIALAAERQAIVAQIKEEKRRDGRHLFDRAREQQVFERAERNARTSGLPPAVARALMRVLVDASHGLQEKRDPEVTESAERRRVLLVGGRGKMGRFFQRIFEERGHEVATLDKGDPLEPDRVSWADVVMVAVPMTEAEGVTAQLCPLIRGDALLCDINSLKQGVCRELQASAGEALGTHPMFGPTVSSLRRQKVVLCPVKPGPLGRWFEAELGRMGAELIRSDPASHDAMMAVVQVLTHFGIMSMGRALWRSGHSLDETLPFMSPIYRLELSMVGRLFSQDPELYREIMVSNPQGPAIREAYLEQAQELAEVLAAGDSQGFVARFEEVRHYFRGFSSEAMALSDQIIETIMSRP